MVSKIAVLKDGEISAVAGAYYIYDPQEFREHLEMMEKLCNPKNYPKGQRPKICDLPMA